MASKLSDAIYNYRQAHKLFIDLYYHKVVSSTWDFRDISKKEMIDLSKAFSETNLFISKPSQLDREGRQVFKNLVKRVYPKNPLVREPNR
jgi:hypothetical protein